MKWLKYVFALGIFALIIAIGGQMLISKLTIEKNYFEKAALVSPGYYFSQIITNKGEPLGDEIVVSTDGYYSKKLVYDGYIYSSPFHKNAAALSFDQLIRMIIITDPEYRIGSRKIGIGSTRDAVERTYRFSTKISDLDSDDEIGFIDNTVWIRFRFSTDDIVTEISIYCGP